MNKVDLQKMLVNTELSVETSTHLQNYRSLTTFLENAIQTSISEGKADYSKLLGSCMQAVKYLEQLIYSHNADVQKRVAQNELLQEIINLLEAPIEAEPVASDVKKKDLKE